jgi:hypothetical protein
MHAIPSIFLQLLCLLAKVTSNAIFPDQLLQEHFNRVNFDEGGQSLDEDFSTTW